MLEVQQKVGTDTVDPASGNLVTLRLVLEHNTSNMYGVGEELRAGGDGVVPRLQARNGGDNDVKGNLPDGGVVLVRDNSDIVTSRSLEDLSDLQATARNNIVIGVLVGVDLAHERFGLRSGCELGECTKDLTTGESADINVVTKDSGIRSGHREGDLGESGVKRLDANNSVLLVVETESAKETVNLELGVGGPDTNVIAVLVGHTRAFNVELDVHAIPVTAHLE